MSIIEKKRTDLIISEPVKKVDIPEFDGYSYIKTELDKLKKIEDKNIKLALRMKGIREKYNEMKNQNKQDIKTIITQKKIIDRINFKLYCPAIKKEIEFHNCCESCYYKLCKPLYVCINRLEAIKHNFNT